METEDVGTRYVIVEQLYAQRELVISPDAGHQVKKEAWERIDFLLDSMVQLDRVQEL